MNNLRKALFVGILSTFVVTALFYILDKFIINPLTTPPLPDTVIQRFEKEKTIILQKVNPKQEIHPDNSGNKNNIETPKLPSSNLKENKKLSSEEKKEQILKKRQADK